MNHFNIFNFQGVSESHKVARGPKDPAPPGSNRVNVLLNLNNLFGYKKVFGDTNVLDQFFFNQNIVGPFSSHFVFIMFLEFIYNYKDVECSWNQSFLKTATFIKLSCLQWILEFTYHTVSSYIILPSHTVSLKFSQTYQVRQEQAGAELGQAQLKLELGFTST